MFGRIFLASLLLVSTIGGTLAQQYDPGASDTEIRLGQTAPYSGPVSAAGSVGLASIAYFEQINKKGGIHGRKIKILSLDDGFSPPKTVEVTRRLVEGDEVLAMYGSVGTPTNAAVQKYLNTKRIPQLFVAGAAGRFNNPKEFPWTTPLIPSIEDEARAMARYVLSAIADPKIAVLYQNDDFGKDFVAALKAGLGDKKPLIISEQSYEVTAPTIQSQIVSAKASGANVFYFAGTQKFGAMQIRLRYELGWKPVNLVSSSAANLESVLKPAGFEQSEGLISVAYTKDPSDSRWENDPGMKEYLAWAKEYIPQKDAGSDGVLVGYLGSYLMAHILEQAGSTLTRDNLLKIATHLNDVKVPILLPGITVTTAPENRSVISKFQLQRFESGRWVPFGDFVSGK
ncbi:ABC transporter substrate-binding protein [Bradyrhizobium sp. 200]|uniref:ABC transporter substrate-binding protein n=1 Tax=Bradyrhizobium sp. 200 TaxID=2782665 RepID=UPI001FFEA5D9|nr:ABC transporter substrate-binding protein [Bradyrhizobium sp. 200]UPJ48398.1 ABC transporter substrate-binding protein [Bradyrhizobium sp. 200]